MLKVGVGQEEAELHWEREAHMTNGTGGNNQLVRAGQRD